MSYEVLARKWRPRTFAELVGQEHVARALINGLDNDRLHHAFLFTGTRGVGKTTIARIFAKALNCETGVGSEPCGACAVCRDVDAGRFVDLVEVDAASRTKVDDTRELLDNVQYAPGRGRFKVYLIDEVHMLSTHSFNALLKTLEEPPPHVKFLLATTDPQKLPVTVLSRCLQFNLKRLETEQIEGYLRRVLGAEAVEYEEDAVAALAEAADGSMRDALSLMDQAIAHGGGGLAGEEVRRMLGTVTRQHVEDLLDALAARDADALWDAATALAAYAPDYGAVLRDLAATVHAAAVAQVVPASASGFAAALAGRMPAEDLQLAYEIAVQARAQLHLAPDLRTGFEMALLRMLAFRPATLEAPARPAAPAGGAEGGGDGAGPGARSAREAARRAAGLSGGSRASDAAQRPGDGRATEARTAAPGARAAGAARPVVDGARARGPGADAGAAGDRVPAGSAVEPPPLPTPRAAGPEPVTAPPVEHAAVEAGVADEAPAAAVPDARDPTAPPSDWHHLFTRLGLKGTAAVLAANSVLETAGPKRYRLVIDPAQGHLRTAAAEERIGTAIARLFGHDARLEVVERACAAESPAARQNRESEERAARARTAMEQDPVVRALCAEFGAMLIPESIRPLDN